MEGEETIGVGFTSSPNRNGNPDSSIVRDDRRQLAEERLLVMSEADGMATYALNALQQKSGTLFQYLGYLNAIRERQVQIKKFNEKLLNQRYFATKEEYLTTRASFNNESLNLDIKVVEIQHKVDEMKRFDKASERNAECDEPRANQARKLETLRLEKFTGTVESWLAFWTRFEERIHKNNKLTTMEKYDYLRQYSAQNVLNRLKTIPLTEEFYDTAIDRLKQEFGSQEKVMAHYTEKLLAIQSVQSRSDLENLRSLVQTIKSSLTALQSVGLSAEHVSPFFTPILKKAVPVELYLEFKAKGRSERAKENILTALSSNSTSVTKDDLVNLVEHLNTVCEDMSAVEGEKLRQLNQKQKIQERSSYRMPTVAALPVIQEVELNRGVKRTDTECIFCGDARHRADSCRKEMTISEKQQKLAQERRCFRCTKTGHTSRGCKETLECGKCKRKNHVSSMCRNPTTAVSCSGSDSIAATTKGCMTVQAYAIGPKGEKQVVRVLFDHASELSFMTARLATSLGIDLNSRPKSRMTVTMFKRQATETETRRVELRLQNLQLPAPKIWISCQTVEELCDDFRPKIDPEVKQKLDKMKIQLADDPDTEKPIDIIIGMDCQVEFLTHNATKLSKRLEVVETALGWTLFGWKDGAADGGAGSTEQQATACLVSKTRIQPLPSPENTKTEEEFALEEQFRKFVEADAFQVSREENQPEEGFIKKFRANMTFDQEKKRFVVRLPMKENVQPSENRNLCVARLRSLENRLARLGLRDKYNAEMRNMIELGFLERVRNTQTNGKIVSYLPHREVIREDSLTTKLRIVFDASAKEKNGRSLNEALENGPNLIGDLLAIVLNFRRHAVAVMADIEKSFPQIIVHDKTHRRPVHSKEKTEGWVVLGFSPSSLSAPSHHLRP